MPVHFYNPVALFWLWLLPPLVLLHLYAAGRRRRALAAFGADKGAHGRRREAAGTCLAAALVVLALARPAWNLRPQEIKEAGRDVVFLLDVSRSMLSDDVAPNRLERAKTAILDCTEDFAGDRVGLVLFAGSAEIRCPLTVDYDYFRMALREALPDSVSAGGTMLANAVEKVVDRLLDPQKKGLQDVILITDGEDQGEDADVVAAARKLADDGARLIAIGIGDRQRGGRIAMTDEQTGETSFMKHDRQEVWTRLNSATLRQMAAAVPGGVYFEVGTGPFDLKNLYRQVMAHAQKSALGSQTVERYEEKFPLFLGAAVLALLASNRWRRK